MQGSGAGGPGWTPEQAGQAGGYFTPQNPGPASAGPGFRTPQSMSYTTPQVPYTQKAEPGYAPTAGVNGGFGNTGSTQPSYYQTGYQMPGAQAPGYQGTGMMNGGYPGQGIPGGGYQVPGNPAGGYQNPGNPGGGYQTPGTGGGYQTPGTPAYTLPPQQAGGQGSYIPQTPYSPGYTSPGYRAPTGYQAPAGYQQGYSAYGQMGRNPQTPPQMDYSQGIPLNGGGYVPQKVPVRRRPLELTDLHLILIGVALAALFAAGVILLNSVPLKIAFLAAALGFTGLLWVKPLTAENKRLTFSIVALALCVLTAVSFVLKKPADSTKKADSTRQSDSGSAVQALTADEQQETAAAAIPAPAETVTPEPQADSALRNRLIEFFNYWNANRQDEMLALCAPSWQSKQDNPRTKLFALIGNRFPKDCTPESVTGTDADTSRRVTLTTTMDRNNGKPAEKFRMTVLMLKENNEWYIDPQSLASYETVETPDPNVTEAPTFTPEPVVTANTPLYYNPNGGEYYHLEQNCRNVGKKNLPLQGMFTYAEINNEPYSKLKPCNVCGAPLREQ